MAKVRTFRWPSGDGFDVVDGEVYYFDNGKRSGRTVDWTVEELEGYANSADSMQETTTKTRAEVHTTRVLLVDGEVVDVEDAKALRDQLQQAIAEFEGENKEAKSIGVDTTVQQQIDREAHTHRDVPDFPGQHVVTGTWTQQGKGDGWVRTAFGLDNEREEDKRLYLKVRPHTLRLLLDMHGEDDNW